VNAAPRIGPKAAQVISDHWIRQHRGCLAEVDLRQRMAREMSEADAREVDADRNREPLREFLGATNRASMASPYFSGRAGLSGTAG
jgi:hypothetical protein